MNSFDVRKIFFEFFKERGHALVPSSSLIPAQDPTLLFTNAGMNQFKDVFLGKEKRSYDKAVSIQKCIRAGGKHNDLENVGFTSRHLTFFEMMGNFSFGAYFKEDAIKYAWEFLTEKIKLPKDKLYASVFIEDQESYDIWNNIIKLSKDRIVKLGEKDNFWQMGDTGPCGPCSEIYIDRGAKFGCGQESCAPGCDCDRFLEIWNLVFMQYNRQLDGSLENLKQKGVDTGMGLERLCSVIENTDSIFETDLFLPLINKIQELTSIDYFNTNKLNKSAFRVLADHIRSSCFAIAAGITPSNDGRGYVLRKIIRRAALFAKKLKSVNIFYDLAPTLINLMGPVYPELETNKQFIIKLIKNEIERFETNLDFGQKILEDYFKESESSKSITGQQAFKLYDTYGFPLELTKVIAQERGFSVDEKTFEQEMEKQRIQSGKKVLQHGTCNLDESIKSQFTGYDELVTKSNINGLILDEESVSILGTGQVGWIITEKSPFYVECGGQVSDKGLIKLKNSDNQEIALEVLDLKKINNAIAAKVKVPEGVTISLGDVVNLVVDHEFRTNTMKNHTATHLLQAALIKVIGKTVKQSGSVVTPEYLRFDFTHHDNLTKEQIKNIEDIVNYNIMANIAVNTRTTNLAHAQKSGVIAFFGEKYNPEDVRVVEVPGFSAELCGGTHVNRTGDIGVFKITESMALSAGNKRIVAVTGPVALELFQDSFSSVKILSQEYKVPVSQVDQAVARQKDELKEAYSEIKSLNKTLNKLKVSDWLNKIEFINEIPFLYLSLPGVDAGQLKDIANLLTDKKEGLYFLISPGDRVSFYAIISDSIKDKVDFKKLGSWLKELGLRGGVKDTVIQGGAQVIVDSLEQKIKDWLQNI